MVVAMIFGSSARILARAKNALTAFRIPSLQAHITHPHRSAQSQSIVALLLPPCRHRKRQERAW